MFYPVPSNDFIKHMFYFKNNGQYISIRHCFIELTFDGGWQKLKPNMCSSIFPIADYSIYSLNFKTLKIPSKIKQNPNFPIPNHLSYPISSKPTKIKHFPSFTTPKLNPYSTKNPPTIPKSSLFIGTFADNDFSPQNRPNHLSPHSSHTGYSKTTHKITPIRE